MSHAADLFNTGATTVGPLSLGTLQTEVVSPGLRKNTSHTSFRLILPVSKGAVNQQVAHLQDGMPDQAE
jgi:hypothetical protein